MSSQTGSPFNAETALQPLKRFQRRTVDYVSRRLLSDPDPVRHFLVADEVGLGKTMVARGVIARTIEALQKDVPRIDVVYICSNGAIAKQNVARLDVTDANTADTGLATRLTLLITQLAPDTDGTKRIKEKGVNFFSLTPGTSLDLKSGGGRKEERAILTRLLRAHLDAHRAEVFGEMMMHPAGTNGWAWTCQHIDSLPFEQGIETRFHTALTNDPALLQRVRDLTDQFELEGNSDYELRRAVNGCVKELRAILARESAEALEPDLIVLDEFQRFTTLLHGDDEAAELARRLFDAKDPDGNQAKVLLLSATPYRMLSLRDDDAEAGDHYREFLDVISFLFGERGPEVRQELEREMHRFRIAMQRLPHSFDSAKDIKSGIETTLRQVIARTERVADTQQQDAMMSDVPIDLTLEPEDLLQAKLVADVAAAAGAPSIVEYWKSAPYPLSFLRDYKLGQLLEDQKSAPSKDLRKAITAAKPAQIDRNIVESYAPLPLNNGRMRALKDLAFENGMGRRLWMPPSLPYFGAPVAASKLLVFSQWAMVPDAISALLSYESEREMGMSSFQHRYSEAFEKRGPLLTFRIDKDKGRMTGLRSLPLVIPSPALISAVDPLTIAQRHGPFPDAAALRVHAKAALGPVVETIHGALGQTPSETTTTATNWEWASPASLDSSGKSFRKWLKRRPDLDELVLETGQSGWNEHLTALSDAAHPGHLTGHPDAEQMLNHLTDLALGSPANCALRALMRVAPDLDPDNPTLLSAATKIAMALRGLFNQPESQALLKEQSEEKYWQAVLHYCIANDLQAVLDEHVHLLLESEGLSSKPQNQTAAQHQERAVARLADAIAEAIALKPARIDVKAYDSDGEHITHDSFNMRGRFATRLLQQAAEDNSVQRTDTVRNAFNSPFRPFVLATTSVGQEGLDFHPWCHRLVHWNLPANPVDLEQREGRVHRYKNHAVRLNIAAEFGDRLTEGDTGRDPWQVLFDHAKQSPKTRGDLEPYWLYEGDHSIERFSLALPYSKETSLLPWLKRSVALYRLAFGQPRQDDLLAYLDKAEQRCDGLDLAQLQISLKP
ncbi:helicase-related protein [Shimia sp. MIT1388]|uniref:helicase-related protein n=1 Tax=Shimia sp. MIT1388 TaxID=3096992 RepID=UPI00399B7C07